MKEKPWFKFTASNWLSGSVQLLSDAEKGTYIDLVSMIWKEGGQLEFNKILARKLRIDYATACDRIKSYCELDIMVCESNILSIKFLDEQLNDIANTSKKNSENAAKRWEKKPTKCDPMPIREEKTEKTEEIREEKTEKNKEDLQAFELFRKAYQGSKRGNETEFDNFKKKTKDWKEVLPDLPALLKCQVAQRECLAAADQFVAPWKNLGTWINNRCWEEEYTSPSKESKSTFKRMT